MLKGEASLIQANLNLMSTLPLSLTVVQLAFSTNIGVH